MKTNFLKAIPIFAFCILYSCDTSTVKETNSILLNCWINAHEKSANNEPDIYRPCDYKEFPANRYRNNFTLNEDGTCEFLVLAPGDDHYLTAGTWEFNEFKNTLTIIDLKGVILLERVIIEIEKDLISFK